MSKTELKIIAVVIAIICLYSYIESNRYPYAGGYGNTRYDYRYDNSYDNRRDPYVAPPPRQQTQDRYRNYERIPPPSQPPPQRTPERRPVENQYSNNNNYFRWGRQHESGLPMQMLKDCPIARNFDYPVGAPHANGYYIALNYREKDHLGEDWNGKKGGNSDLGDPIHSVADGIIFIARDYRGKWGNVIRILHNIGTNNEPDFVEAYYAHMDTILVREGSRVKRGQIIGTIGTAHGQYLAHLHFEMRDKVNLPMQKGFASTAPYHIPPSEFIKRYR